MSRQGRVGLSSAPHTPHGKAKASNTSIQLCCNLDMQKFCTSISTPHTILRHAEEIHLISHMEHVSVFHPPPHKENRNMQSHRLKKQKPKTHNLDLSGKGTSPNSVPSMRNFWPPPTGSKSTELPPDFYPLHHLGQLFSLTEIIFL